MGTRKTPILIDQAKCPPCSGLICIGVCPVGVLQTDANGKPQIVDVISCTQCGVCANLCPTQAITVNTKQSKNRQTVTL